MRLSTAALLLPALLAVAGAQAPGTADPGTKLQYAAKYLCGRDDGKILAPGVYHTAINIHNPAYREIKFLFKVAAALPMKQGPISNFQPVGMGPDGALELTCEIIQKMAGTSAPTGFVVIQSDFPLNVVGVYTATLPNGQSLTLEMERVAPRLRDQ